MRRDAEGQTLTRPSSPGLCYGMRDPEVDVPCDQSAINRTRWGEDGDEAEWPTRVAPS